MFQGTFKSVLRKFQGNVMDALKKVQGYLSKIEGHFN